MISGKLSPVPQFVVVAHGQNDGSTADANMTAEVTDFLTKMRAATSATTPIFVSITLGANGTRNKMSAITAGFNAYVAANPTDTKVYLYDVGSGFNLRVANAIGTADFGADGLHPSNAGHTYVAADLYRYVYDRLNPSGVRPKPIGGGPLKVILPPALWPAPAMSTRRRLRPAA